MSVGGVGVLENSKLFFYSPSQTAKSLYYYAVSSGHFFCDKNYHLVRKTFKSILVLYVLGGSFTFVNSQGRHITAHTGEAVLLDCYQPHEYYTTEALEFLWVHICGADSVKLYNEIVKANGNVINAKDNQLIKKLISRIINSMEAPQRLSEQAISIDIYKLLLELLNPFSQSGNESKSEYITEQVRSYIFENLSEKLSLAVLSQIAQMSPSHFSRVFKAQTGFSPYDYVLTARLNKAKDLLQKTDLSISQIAEATGFNSESNFIYFFTGNTGVSPTKFRKHQYI